MRESHGWRKENKEKKYWREGKGKSKREKISEQKKDEEKSVSRKKEGGIRRSIAKRNED